MLQIVSMKLTSIRDFRKASDENFPRKVEKRFALKFKPLSIWLLMLLFTRFVPYFTQHRVIPKAHTWYTYINIKIFTRDRRLYRDWRPQEATVRLHPF